MSRIARREKRYHFQFDAVSSSSILSTIETREKSKEDASMVKLIDDWNIYLVRDEKFSRKIRKKLSEDEINDFLKIENKTEKTVFSLADFKRVLLSECP